MKSAKNAIHQSCRSACVSVLEKVAGDARDEGAMRDIDDINDAFESQLSLAAEEASTECMNVYDTGAVWHRGSLYGVV